MTANEGLNLNPVVVQSSLPASANNNVCLTERRSQKTIISSVSLISLVTD